MFVLVLKQLNQTAMAIDLLKLLSAIVYINTGFESICACDASNDNYQTEHWDSDTLILNKIKGGYLL